MAVHHYERAVRQGRSESFPSHIPRSPRHCVPSPTSWQCPSQRSLVPGTAFGATWQAVVRVDRLHSGARESFAEFVLPTRQRTCGDSLALSLELAWPTLSSDSKWLLALSSGAASRW